MGIPSALASLERETTQPSLLDRTTTGFFLSFGLKTCSQETKKLLQSIKKKLHSFVDDIRDHAPDLEVASFLHLQYRVSGVFRDKGDLPFPNFEPFDGKFTAHDGDDDLVIGSLKRTIDDEDVTGEDPSVAHRVSRHSYKKSRCGTGDQKLVEVKRLVEVVFGRRGESRLHIGKIDRQRQRCICLGFENFYISSFDFN